MLVAGCFCVAGIILLFCGRNKPNSLSEKHVPLVRRAVDLSSTKRIVESTGSGLRNSRPSAGSTAITTRRAGSSREIASSVSDADVQVLRGDLQRIRNPNAANIEDERSLVNEMLRCLKNGEHLRGNYENVLVGIYRDTNQDAVIRDYSIQFLGDYYESAKDKALVESVLWDAAMEKQGTIAGTALLALNRISKASDQNDRDQLCNETLKIASDDSYGQAARTTALRLCGMQKTAGAIPIAQRILRKSDCVSLRIAAAATLGDLRAEESIPLLKSVSGSLEDPARYAAQNALRKITNRQEIVTYDNEVL